ncbi:hypothetical protein L7F22_000404 [Adiantum nelumboides]|nr:hypothetical protein [Adiantum nelumboides]
MRPSSRQRTRTSLYRTLDEVNPLQQLLEQFEKARLQERRLRKQELSKLVAAIKASHTPSSITVVQALVRNSPNFTKYDGALATLGVLVGGLLSFRQGNHQRSQLLMRTRVGFQAATVALMVGTVYLGTRKEEVNN